MNASDVELWAKIFKEDQKHIRETGWSYFTGPNAEEEQTYETDNNNRTSLGNDTRSAELLEE